MWGWAIQKDSDVRILARGKADSVLLAKEAAEIAWIEIKTGSLIVLTPAPFDRRLSAERLISLQRALGGGSR